jgi:hypothetical protein
VATDNVKVTHINMIIHSSFFNSYDLKEEKLEFSVELEKLLKIFRCSSNDDTFTFKYNNKENY